MSRQLADRIRRTYTGPMWHGPSLSEALVGVSNTQAAARPLAGAHTIWELTLHTALWAEIAVERLDERELDYPAGDRDWTPVTDTSPAAWAAAIQRIETAYQTLAARAEQLSADDLRANVPAQDHTVREMMHGVIEHGVYHAGQMMLLRRVEALAGHTAATRAD